MKTRTISGQTITWGFVLGVAVLPLSGCNATEEQDQNPSDREGVTRVERPPSGLPPKLERFDKDKDGRVSRSEFPGPGRLFKRLDHDGDGYLDSKDMDSGSQIMAFDANGDGRVSGKEFKGPSEIFKKLDRNSDGYIDRKEIPRPAHLIEDYDKNDDGKLSRAEFPGVASSFDQMDRDGDGFIESNELRGEGM